MTLHDCAVEYVGLGLSVIATSKNKRAACEWKQFQVRFPSEDELTGMFSLAWTSGLAIITGRVSGGLEVIDIDTKYDLTGTLYEDIRDKIKMVAPELWSALVIVRTRSGGYHLIYRCTHVEKSQKLAGRASTERELSKDPQDKVKVLVETRGESAFFVAYPTPGYQFLQHSLARIPAISLHERRLLIDIAMSFNQVERKKIERRQHHQSPVRGFTPLNDFNQRGDVIALLEKHGWVIVGSKGDKTHFLRPGNTDKDSSGNYDHALGLFSVFTSSSVFESETGYRPSAVFAMLECNGDFKVAAKRLYEMGFGDRVNLKRKDPPGKKI